MNLVTDLIVPLVVALIAASGFWTFILYLIQRRNDKKDSLTKLMLGLANREILRSCFEMKQRGYMYKDEYDDLMKYLWKPYKALDGNGTAEKAVNEVEKLELRERE